MGNNRGYCPPMDDFTLETLKKNNHAICIKCDEPFKIGDRTYVTVAGARTKKTKRYHTDCWESMGY